MQPLDIIYADEWLVAINKPHGLLVHRTPLATDARDFAVQTLRNQIGQYVYPCHRLDRKTSGVLLFALNNDTNSRVQQQFAQNKVQKTYLAIVRGFTKDQEEINYPLTDEGGVSREAVTHYKTHGHAELPLPSHRFDSSRYSLLELTPKHGRIHQIRKHLAHIDHPIIGDRPHGCNKQNKIFKEQYEMTNMLLHARKIEFIHPETGNTIEIFAPVSAVFKRMCVMMGFDFKLCFGE